ncbi:DUF4126 domain-containing protein [Ornithinimicrobium pratense]|uniref:DUF4126 domain-containing protein n=1 Tax=Ornithinimicrobium pratense TaxID=2593973 RepID=A0A5J6V3I2_9MICO|nr:DUF4126 domain-containing protein [Ornithinimicrobium pratense]QFG67721.1 DUF4126 domain-containing protein [Ornithinimicrobium pratense]
MLAALTGAGLSAAAGLNAYIPFLLVALIARFTEVLDLPVQYAWIESWWAIGIAAVLLLSEVVLDKIALVDHLNDAVGTFIRPATGGLIFAATTAAGGLERGSSFMQDNPWIGVLLGILTAGVVHTGKAVARPVVNASTGGLGTPVVSAAEDGAAVTMSLVAIFLPVLVVFLFLMLLWGGFMLWRRGRAARQKRDQLMAEAGYE